MELVPVVSGRGVPYFVDLPPETILLETPPSRCRATSSHTSGLRCGADPVPICGWLVLESCPGPDFGVRATASRR
jgi:hypothetical protein